MRTLLALLGFAMLFICDLLGRNAEDLNPWLIVAAGALAPAAVVVALIDGRDR